jgi:hypothetical protein
MLDACDRLGLLVMDELTDIWTEGKSAFDYSLAFPEWWERDLEAMIAKDFRTLCEEGRGDTRGQALRALRPGIGCGLWRIQCQKLHALPGVSQTL